LPQVLPGQHKSLLSQTKDLLRQAGLRARKGLGQHFLVDGAILRHILSAAEISPDDLVIEVGPGLGVLTRGLADHAGRVLAVEKDENLARVLKQTMAAQSNVTIVSEDILKLEPAGLLREFFTGQDPVRYKVVANLPYYITSPVLRHFLEAEIKPQTVVVMVQKEVARQITAGPGEMSLLSVAVQLYGRPRIVKYVPAGAFYPPPEVDSAILKITVYPRPAVDVEIAGFFGVVRAGFSAARKQIVNSLSRGLKLTKHEVSSMLESAGIDPKRRAETLSIEEWGRLWGQYHQYYR
jgi:16S rRNA (adenine1518-N6/adenine1519-N6)-dimethyltransferase